MSTFLSQDGLAHRTARVVTERAPAAELPLSIPAADPAAAEVDMELRTDRYRPDGPPYLLYAFLGVSLVVNLTLVWSCLLYTSPSPRD